MSGARREGEEQTLLGPVRVGRSVDAVIDRLVTAIAVGDFSPGERLPPERELAALLGVGRQTLREALARLRDAGYVVTRRGRTGGAIVQDGWGTLTDDALGRTLVPSLDELAELSDARCLVESLIARTAAERRTAADIAALHDALAAYERADDTVAARRADHALHHGVVATTRNRELARLSRDMLARVNVGLPIEPFDEALWRKAVPEHRALVAAVEAGDGDEAARIAMAHFAFTEKALRRAAGRAGNR